MVIEGILTTETSDGRMHVAPIGPHVDEALRVWTLKPFQSSTTFSLLHAQGRGVFHVVDDALLMVRSVLGQCNPPYPSPSATYRPESGWILENAARAIPLTVVHWDVSKDRAIAECQAGDWIEQRPFWGWNRARHSLLELAVMASRRSWLEPAELRAAWDQHRTIVEKTAGEKERQALRLIEEAFFQPPSAESHSST